MSNPAIVTQDLDKVAECLILFALANSEIAKRKLASREWDAAHVVKVLAESKDMVKRAVRLRQSQFDVSAANDRLPIEFVERMSTLCIYAQAGL